MGVTIHFEGQAKSESDYRQILEKGISFAKRVNSEIIELDSEFKILQRVKDELDWNYEGQVKGIQIQPHENTDPIVLEFDKDLYIQEYCKTQFEGIATHIEIIGFLKDIEPHFESLEVIDEGEFWETNNVELLEEHFENCFTAIDNAKEENPNLNGPYRIGDRIIDLMD